MPREATGSHNKPLEIRNFECGNTEITAGGSLLEDFEGDHARPREATGDP